MTCSHADYTHDEALGVAPVTPLAVVLPSQTSEVAETLRLCDDRRVPVVARGSGTGLSGGALPPADGMVVSFERMTGSSRSTRTTTSPWSNPGSPWTSWTPPSLPSA